MYVEVEVSSKLGSVTRVHEWLERLQFKLVCRENGQVAW